MKALTERGHVSSNAVGRGRKMKRQKQRKRQNGDDGQTTTFRGENRFESK
jgi:hypothetical protein